MFCTICEACPSIAGRSDFVSRVCTSFKQESVTTHSLREKLFDAQVLRAFILVIFTSPAQFYRPKLIFLSQRIQRVHSRFQHQLTVLWLEGHFTVVANHTRGEPLLCILFLGIIRLGPILSKDHIKDKHLSHQCQIKAFKVKSILAHFSHWSQIKAFKVKIY